jgi:hypothetical protein
VLPLRNKRSQLVRRNIAIDCKKVNTLLRIGWSYASDKVGETNSSARKDFKPTFFRKNTFVLEPRNAGQ